MTFKIYLLWDRRANVSEYKDPLSDSPYSKQKSSSIPSYCAGMRCFSTYPDISSLIGKEKCVFTFSFSMVSMLNVYRIVLKHRMRGSFLKHALYTKNGKNTDKLTENAIIFLFLALEDARVKDKLGKIN